MSRMESLHDVLMEELRDLYSAEEQLLRALPKVAKAVTSSTLREAIESHLKETQGQMDRLTKIEKQIGKKLAGKTCKAMKGLIAEADEALSEYKGSDFLDVIIIGACQRVEHYEMAAYGTTRSIAEQLGLDDIADLLQETLDEESAADEKLTEISEDEVLPACMDDSSDEEDESDDDEEPSMRRSKDRAETNR